MNNEAEKGIIGALLMEQSAIANVTELSPEMFTDSLLGKAFYEFKKAYITGEQITVLNISQALANDYPVNDVNEILKECINSITSSVQIKPYAKIVYNSHRVKQLGNILNRFEPNTERIDEQIGMLVNDIQALQSNQTAKLKRIDKIIDEYKDQYFIDREERLIKLGLPKIDDALGGLEGGDMIVIGARPAVGKSAFVVQAARHIAESGMKVAIYNLEMSEKQEYERLISSLSGINLKRIRRAKSFLNDEKERFDNANQRLKGIDLYLRSGSVTVRQIKAETKSIGFDLIIIDYLQLVRPDRKFNNRFAEVGDVSMSIKALAMEYNIPIIALSQMNRASEGKDTKEPTMSELREAGNIEQDASIICLMWNENEEDRTQKGFKVEKNRQGEQLKISLKFDGSQMKFEESDGFVPVKKDKKQSTPFD